jgi:hypothetical protein
MGFAVIKLGDGEYFKSFVADVNEGEVVLTIPSGSVDGAFKFTVTPQDNKEFVETTSKLDKMGLEYTIEEPFKHLNL